MDAADILQRLQDLGVGVRAEAGNIIVNPASRVPLDLKPWIRQQKAALLELLAGPAPSLSEADGPDLAELLSWAAQAAEEGLVSPQPVHFLETPLRPYTTAQVGRYCREKLRFLAVARSHRVTGSWGRFTPEWWREMQAEALQALCALKAAIDQTELSHPTPDQS
jgi:hypothetical protein